MGARYGTTIDLPGDPTTALQAVTKQYADTKAPASRLITAGTGLSGGGSLAADRTLVVVYGTGAGTACQGNDARLSDARTPLTHTHTAGQVGTVVSRHRRETSTGTTSATASTSALSVFRLDATMVAGRLYLIMIPNAGVYGSAANSTCGVQITYTTDGSTPGAGSAILTLDSVPLPIAGQSYGIQLVASYAPASNMTFRALYSIWRQAGTGTVASYGHSAWPAEMLISDCGADPGSMGTNL